MSIKWYFYSDTNSRADEIELILQKRSQSLTSIQKLDDIYVKLEQTPHAILFLKANTVYNVYDLCQEVSALYPHAYIILIAPDNNENVKKAMHVGASNLLTFSSHEEEITEVIIQAQKFMSLRAKQENTPVLQLTKKNTKVISISSSKGGIGRTMLTVNLATALAKQGKKVAVIDANLQFGEVALLFDIKPKLTIYDWVKEGYDRGLFSTEKYMSKHSTGVSILAAPQRPEFFEAITEQHIETAVNELKKYYDVILIDHTSTLSEIHLKSLVLSDEILLITTNDIPVLRSNRLFLDTLQSLQLSEKVKLVLNRDSRKKAISDKKVEEILQIPLYASLPEQGQQVAASINEGIPFLLKNSRAVLSKVIFQMAQKLFSETGNRLEGYKKQKSWLAFSK